MPSLAGLHVAVFAWAWWGCMIRAPFADMISWLDFYLQYRVRGDLPAYLFAFHNEHRLAWFRVLTALDAEAFGCGGIAFIAVATASLLISAWLVTRELAAAAGGLAWLCPMLFLLSANVVDCSIPINGVYPVTLAFVLGGIVLFDGADAKRRVAALLLVAGAGLANAVGLVAWPVLLWLAWRGGAGWRWRLAIALAAGLYGALYLHDVPATPGVPVTASAAAHAAKFADYLLAYLGLPLSRVDALAGPSRLFGGVLLLCGVIAVAHVSAAARTTRLHRIAAAMILFALLAAGLAAAGRADLAEAVRVPVRYTVLLAPLHAGLLCLLLPRVWSARRSVWPAGIAAALVLLAVQIAGARAAIIASRAMASAVARYYAGERDAEVARVMFPDLATADAVLARLHADGLLRQ